MFASKFIFISMLLAFLVRYTNFYYKKPEACYKINILIKRYDLIHHTHIKNYIFFLFSTLIYICKKVIISNENKLDTSKNKSQGFNKIVLLLQRENGWDNEINK